MKKHIILALFLVVSSMQFLEAETFNTKINIPIKIEPNEVIYAKSMDISLDNPNINISEIQTSIEPIKSYDPIFKEIGVFNNSFDITVNLTKNNAQNLKDTNLYISYLTNNNNVEKIIPINLSTKATNVQKISTPELPNPTPVQSIKTDTATVTENGQTKQTEKKSLWGYVQKVSTYTQNILTKTNSNWLRIFLVFILGILMSFTPCIYPIIPITIGILQLQGGKSVFYNFMLSCSYSIGIAITFALFGLTAALTGHLFGQILTQPLFVIFIVAMLIYLALSMFGLYDMYVPKVLSSNNNNINPKGSLLSAFVFGAISGSIASPCLSPGLALLLTIVAALGNKLLGFLLLFSFGIGLSIPLLIIGTFSSSINILPQAGIWMVEVKKLFGFMLFGMAFYYLNNILPYNILLILIGIFLISSGVYYLVNISAYDSKFWKITKNIIGFGLIASSVLIFVKSYQTTFCKELEIEQIGENIWLQDYNQAVEQAKQTNKKLLIDIGASFCTICKAIDKYIFNDPKVKIALGNFVNVKVDATNTSSQPYATLQPKYNIFGVPTILIIDPNTGELFKRWGSELYEIPKEQIIQELEKLK